ncbi:LamG domain-containing protein [Roseibacillus ishigakijimensis]|uniref:LamG domain-containing protein n=1 Tax=Roseibacillus ishigakijimensis TaxID=454146 RepID=A0A934RSY1_9BACT|nr:LamG domain-containing protein [Roseibacillus ishigakijimensis]MBK1835076.1 LamG domain-containing protein [Roseibacillus ishigakijimensis]
MKQKHPQVPLVCTGLILGATLATTQADLVHYYSLDDTTQGTITDTGSGATVNSNGSWRGDAGADLRVTGLIDGALRMNDEDGGNGSEHFFMDLEGLDGASAVTMSMWFKLEADNDNSGGYTGLFMARQVTFDNDDDGIADLTAQNWGMAFRNSSGPRRLDVRVNGQASNNLTDLPDQEWHHVAFTWDGTTGERIVYVNGEVEDTATQAIGKIVSAGEWRLSDDACCGGREINGTVDDVAVYDEVLDETRIAQIYQEGLLGCGITGRPGDTDCDGILDEDEISGAMNPFDASGNFVGVGNGGAPTDPNDSDSDDDGVPDGREVTGALNPFVNNVLDDTPLGGPYTGHDPTNPNKASTDGDSLTDLEEIENFLNPNDATGEHGDDGDPDNDGLGNLAEIDPTSISSPYEATDPQNGDSDGDGLNDGEEVNGTANTSFGSESTDPNLADSDEDGLSDGDEVLGRLNPFKDGVLVGAIDGAPYTDHDATDPNEIYSDSDSMTDKEEIDNRLDPNNGDGAQGDDGDPDGDLLTNVEEVLDYFTNPLVADTDGDGLDDLTEVEGDTDPLLADTDGDTLNDFDEVNGLLDGESHGFGPTDGSDADSDGDGVADRIELAATPPSDPNDSSAVPAVKPVAYWALDEPTGSIAREWVNRNDAESNGPALWVPGKFGNAADIDGASSGDKWFQAQTLQGLKGATSLTVMAWIHVRSGNTGYKGILTTRGEGPTGNENWGLNIEGNNANTDNRVPTSAGGASEGINNPGPSSGQFGTLQWYHVAMTFNGTTNEVITYTNGVAGATGTAAYPTALTGEGWTIGIDVNQGTRDLDGLIDDAAIFPVALSAEDILTIYNEGENNGKTVGDLYDLTAPPVIVVDSNLEITAISRNGDSVDLTWNSGAVAGTSFNVKASSTLDTPIADWTVVAQGIPNDGETTSITVPNQTEEKKFFVVEEN